MLVHLPGAYRAAQIFGAAYQAAPLGHQYALELIAQAVERDISYRNRPVEETRLALEASRLWVISALNRHPFERLHLLPTAVSNFLQNRKASEILIPPALISEPPSSRPPIAPPPKRVPLVMWREPEAQPLLTEWGAQVSGLQKLIDAQPAGDIQDPALLSAIYFYQMGRAAMRLAYFDELTGLRNRHELERLTPQFEAELLRKRKNTPGDFFLMIDIDFFKKINDTYGHAAGDIVLQKVAKTLFQGFRSGDFFFRQGGEEFLAFLSNVGEKGIARLAQKIRRQIEELEIFIPGEEKPLKVTVSIGVARFRVLSAKDLESPNLPKTPVARGIEESDEALYVAKERGRNRVVYYWKK